jgi:hypothetical protein
VVWAHSLLFGFSGSLCCAFHLLRLRSAFSSLMLFLCSRVLRLSGSSIKCLFSLRHRSCRDSVAIFSCPLQSFYFTVRLARRFVLSFSFILSSIPGLFFVVPPGIQFFWFILSFSLLGSICDA